MPEETARRANECRADVAEDLTNTAANLRAAVDAGTAPPKAVAQLAAMLENLAARMRPE